jgi:hypothetical protein
MHYPPLGASLTMILFRVIGDFCPDV